MIKIIHFIFLMLFSLLISACASKKDIIVKTEFKEKLIPIKCDLKIPKKPISDGSFEIDKEIMIYYLEVEDIAKKCTSN